MLINKALIYYSKNELIFTQKQKFGWVSLLKETNENGGIDTKLVPRFTLNNTDIFTDLPANEHLKPTEEILMKAIKWGCILQINYKGREDTLHEGHERTIYPVAYGLSKEGKPLLRGYHLKGWSVSKPGPLEKEWRMFRVDRLLNIVFTGSFFRLAPEGYNDSGDKGIFNLKIHADFTSIRNLQQKLLNNDKITLKDNVIPAKVNAVTVKDLNYKLNLLKPYDAGYINKKDAKNTRLTFCKTLANGGPWLVIIGVNIEKGKTFKIKDQNNNIIGTYISQTTIMANDLGKYVVGGLLNKQKEFKAYVFIKSQ